MTLLCMDGRVLASGGTGVSTYATALRAAQFELEPASLVLQDCGNGSRAARYLEAFRLRPITLARDGARLHATDIFRLAQVRFDITGQLLTLVPPTPGGVMHWPYPVPIWIEGWINIYTIHDLIPILFPDLTSINPNRHRRLLRRVVEAADRIVTVSETSRAEIVETFAVSSDFVVNCSAAIQSDNGEGALPPGLRRGEYFLVCGTIEPRKNHLRIAEAHRASGTKLPLVIAGPPGFKAVEITKQAASRTNTIWLPYLARDVLATLIRCARALLMPSLAEGFGLPVAEAMAAGTPVLTSDGGALAETAGGSAILVDPLSISDMAASIGQLTNDADLCRSLAIAGRENVRRFSPQNFVARLATVYAGDFPLVDRDMTRALSAWT